MILLRKNVNLQVIVWQKFKFANDRIAPRCGKKSIFRNATPDKYSIAISALEFVILKTMQRWEATINNKRAAKMYGRR